ncbi:hypothetical protein JOQ06_017903, partial [Pogonophryne albipinna]
MWALMCNMEQRPASPETEGLQTETLSLSLSLSLWQFGVRLHLRAAVGTFDSFHCVHDLSPERAPRSPNFSFQ